MYLTSVAIASRIPLIRNGLLKVLNEQFPELRIVYISDLENLANGTLDNVQILILDQEFSWKGIIKNLKIFLKKHRDVRCAVLTQNSTSENVYKLWEAGVHSILTMTCDEKEVIKCLNNLKENGIYFNGSILSQIRKYDLEVKTLTKKNAKHYFNENEKKIVSLIWEEKTNKEISAFLSTSTRTIEKIRMRLIHKLGAKNSIGLVKKALINGVLELPK